jgi:hypothetical protein
MAALVRITLDVIVREKPFFLRLVVVPRQADDDAMDMGLAPRIAHPRESAVRECDLELA